MELTKNQKIAEGLLDLNLNPIPVGNNKVPLIQDWSTEPMTKEEIPDYDFTNIGVNTGSLSYALEVIDIDLKNLDDPTPENKKRFMELFQSKIPTSLLSKLVIQSTVSGGYHYIYRTEDVTSSHKLATTADGKTIIETRGEGGYIQITPTKGYKMVQGKFSNIPVLKPEERLVLMTASKLLNKTIHSQAAKRMSGEDRKYLEKFKDYNDEMQFGLDLLYEHGWTYHSGENDPTSDWVNLTRPDSKSKGLHASYNKEGKFLYVWTPNQKWFDTEKPYNNHHILAELEFDGNYPRAYAKLYEEGYGGEEEAEVDSKTDERKEKESFKEMLFDLSFLSDDIEENTYLDQARKGIISQGLTTGWPKLDKNFRLKPNSFNIGLGYDGVGKSLVITHLATASNVMHDWKWGMIMPENRTAMTRRRLIEAMSGKQITYFRSRPEEFEEHLKQSRENFKIISNKRHWGIPEVIEMGKRLYEEFGISALLIDPYNFFKVTGNGYSFNNDILSQLRVFAEEYCSVYVMAHPSSEAPRKNIDQATGLLKKPKKYEIQGGADFPYRVDDFFTVHRIVNHPDKDVRRVVQFSVEKIKETETGGEVHPEGEWTELIWDVRDGFMGYFDEDGNNPMLNHLKNKVNNKKDSTVESQQEQIYTIKPASVEDAFMDI